MTLHTSTADRTRPSNTKLNLALWLAQIILAALFGMVGAMKTFAPTSEIAKTLVSAGLSMGLVRLIGVCEIAGAIGLILPAAFRIKPSLTALAAAGLFAMMVFATVFHVSRGEFQSIPAPVVLGGLTGFVAWGRYKALPVQ